MRIEWIYLGCQTSTFIQLNKGIYGEGYFLQHPDAEMIQFYSRL